jgi:hypothetical protein
MRYGPASHNNGILVRAAGSALSRTTIGTTLTSASRRMARKSGAEEPFITRGGPRVIHPRSSWDCRCSMRLSFYDMSSTPKPANLNVVENLCSEVTVAHFADAARNTDSKCTNRIELYPPKSLGNGHTLRAYTVPVVADFVA